MAEPGLEAPDGATGWTDMTRLCRAFARSLLMLAAATPIVVEASDRRSEPFGDSALGRDLVPSKLYWPFNRSPTGDTDPQP
ncbi:hypothetical protein ACOZ4F_01675 (plasmid) [Haloarcula marismortui]|uniref:hypothetical protein n=1 Tax=Haloarcula marismortui TaxID=2238 RepID=UPI003C7338B8